MARESGRPEHWAGTASSILNYGSTQSPKDSKRTLGLYTQHLPDNSAHHIGPTEVSSNFPIPCGKNGSNGSLRRQLAVKGYGMRTYDGCADETNCLLKSTPRKLQSYINNTNNNTRL